MEKHSVNSVTCFTETAVLNFGKQRMLQYPRNQTSNAICGRHNYLQIHNSSKVQYVSTL